MRSKSIGSMVSSRTTPGAFEQSIALGLGKQIGEFSLCAVVSDTSCAQSAAHIVQVCQEAISAQNYTVIEAAFPGCLMTEKHGGL